MERKRNNSSWVCDRLEELISEYEIRCEATYSKVENLTYRTIIEELEEILYA